MQAQSIFSSQGHLQLRCNVYLAVSEGPILKIFWNLALHLALGQLFRQGPPIDHGQGGREQLGTRLHIMAELTF